jgi:hypothetical protein
LEESAGISNQCVIDGGGAEERGEVAAWSVEDGFRKQQRTGDAGIVKHFVVEAARVIHATRHHALNDAQPRRAVIGFSHVVLQRL